MLRYLAHYSIAPGVEVVLEFRYEIKHFHELGALDRAVEAVGKRLGGDLLWLESLEEA